MKSIFNLFVRSAKELKSVKCLAVTSLLIALDLVLKFTVEVKIGEFLVIAFAFIALSSIGMLYGPTVGFFAGVITDLLGFLIKPNGAFNPVFTIIEALGGLIYGLFLYNAMNDKWLIPRIVAAKTTVTIVCNLFLTTGAISLFYGNGFLALFPARAIKNLAQLPIDIFLLCLLLPFVLKAFFAVFGKNARTIDEHTIFSDEGMGRAMSFLICALIVIVGSLGLASNYIKEKNSELTKTVKAQEERIASLEESLAQVYEKLGIELPSEE
ncbi:MAG: folate family ECF transporter S component [Oscillospiraceae bacterium]|nr:folate family ECF transporter S component [Oscillospiraceae bacterium]